MKRCPQCDLVFPDVNRFCDIDGTPLVPDAEPRTATRNASDAYEVSGAAHTRRSASPETGWTVLTIGAAAGLSIGVLLFLAYYGLSRRSLTQRSAEQNANAAVMKEQAPVASSRPSPLPSASSESSPSPIALPSPSVMPRSAVIGLSSKPVSTGRDDKDKTGGVTIRLTNGTSIEADEAWETGEGIWYRHRGIVTLLKHDEVKAVERPQPVTPSPSPSATPSP